MASLTALLLSIVLGPWLIARLREFQIGQHIREDGPQSHLKKAGTPTMGGLLICVSIVVPTLLWANLRVPAVWVALVGLVELRRGRILGRLHQRCATSEPGADGAPEVGAGSAGGAADRRAAAGDERARRLLHQHERAVLQEFQAGSADSSAGCTTRGPIRWRSSSSSVS